MVLRKKLKVTTSTVEPLQEYDADRFMSFAAQKQYIDLVVKKKAIQKRGLQVTMDSVSKQVKNRKWEELVKHLEIAVVLVFRELYANM